MRDFLVEAGLDRLAKRMLRAELYAIEIILAICSLWAATHLMTPTRVFDTYANGYAFMRGLLKHEEYWGFIAAIGAIAKVLGLGLFTLDVTPRLSILLRCFGLTVSGFFWTVTGSSFLMGNPDSIAGLPLVMLGASAWWTLLRFPAVPKPQSPLL